MLGGQDVQAVGFDLAGGVEVVAGGIVEEARGRVEDVCERTAFLLAPALTARVGVADVLQAADGAVDGLDGGGGEGAFAGGRGGFEAQAAGLADGGGEGPGGEEGGHFGWWWWYALCDLPVVLYTVFRWSSNVESLVSRLRRSSHLPDRRSGQAFFQPNSSANSIAAHD